MKTRIPVIAFFVMASIMTSQSLSAYDFSIKDKSGIQLYYTVTDQKKGEVSVSAYADDMGQCLRVSNGTVLEIPAMVMRGKSLYKVTSVGERAFRDMEGLSGVRLPSNLRTIGNEAFCRCVDLNSIVFPARQVEIGTDAFGSCPSIGSVSFGSEWKTIDFKWFEDSDVFSSVFIPASVTSVRNVDSACSLSSIDVDGNNRTYQSYDGMLMSRGWKTLIACPREKRGAVALPEMTENIENEAFRGCDLITRIDLPMTIHEFDFNVFEDCKSLNSLIIRSGVTFFTGKTAFPARPVFALALPTQTTVYVPAKLLKAYRSILCTEEGYYCTTSWAGTPEEFYGKDELMQKNQLKAI